MATRAKPDKVVRLTFAEKLQVIEMLRRDADKITSGRYTRQEIAGRYSQELGKRVVSKTLGSIIDDAGIEAKFKPQKRRPAADPSQLQELSGRVDNLCCVVAELASRLGENCIDGLYQVKLRAAYVNDRDGHEPSYEPKGESEE